MQIFFSANPYLKLIKEAASVDHSSSLIRLRQHKVPYLAMPSILHLLISHCEMPPFYLLSWVPSFHRHLIWLLSFDISGTLISQPLSIYTSASQVWLSTKPPSFISWLLCLFDHLSSVYAILRALWLPPPTVFENLSLITLSKEARFQKIIDKQYEKYIYSREKFFDLVKNDLPWILREVQGHRL